MQPMWLCICLGRKFTKTFENPLWIIFLLGSNHYNYVVNEAANAVTIMFIYGFIPEHVL